MIDADLVNQLIARIGADLTRLELMAKKPRELFLSSEVDELATERLLERALGRLIDVNFHVLTESGEAPPDGFEPSFFAMNRLKVMPFELAEQLALASGLLTRLATDYGEVDPARIFAMIQTLPATLRTYLACVIAFITGEVVAG